MSIIAVMRFIKALEKKIKQLEGYREKAKDKGAWDRKNGKKLEFAHHQVSTLKAKIVVALEKQGQFSHAPGRKAGGGHHGE